MARRRILGRMAAGAALLGAVGGTAAFLAVGLGEGSESARYAPPEGAPNAADMRAALGLELRDEARRAAEEGAALGAVVEFTAPARLTAHLLDARMVREIRSVEPLTCAPLEDDPAAGVDGWRCAYVARYEAWCDGPACADYGRVGAERRRIEERGIAAFRWSSEGWRARPVGAQREE